MNWISNIVRPKLKNVFGSAKREVPENLWIKCPETGEMVFIHTGTVSWNAHRQRWILIGVQQFGSSVLGEIWYSESTSPFGPWKKARKIVTHDKYSFYNPAHHPFLDQENGRVIYFEGTYTAEFSGSTSPTPRYDYNQIMYRLDLSDARLRLE